MSTANIIDLDYNSLQITHRADDVSEASFTLARKFDNPDYTLGGVYSPISNQNDVVIVYKGKTLFTGKVTEIKGKSENDTIECVCTGYQQWCGGLPQVTIPVSGLTTPRYLYDAVISDVQIKAEELINDIAENPEDGGLLPSTYSPVSSSKSATEQYNGVRVHLGYQRIEYTYSKSGTIIWVNGAPFDSTDLTTEYDPSEKWDEVFYYDIVVEISPDDAPSYKKTYEWVGGGLPEGNMVSAKYYAQTTWTLKKQHYNSETGEYEWHEGNDLGYYTLGAAPYQDISPSNTGSFVSNSKYVVEGDTELRKSYEEGLGGMLNGVKNVSLIPNLYLVREPNYNYIAYAKKFATYQYAQLLHSKAKSTDSNEFKTSATVSITLDALLYYNIQLLTKINISNTTASNIYNNDNGFPLSVKSISISGETCSATLELNNEKTDTEVEAEETALEEAEPEAPDTYGGFKDLKLRGDN